MLFSVGPRFDIDKINHLLCFSCRLLIQLKDCDSTAFDRKKIIRFVPEANSKLSVGVRCLTLISINYDKVITYSNIWRYTIL